MDSRSLEGIHISVQPFTRLFLKLFSLFCQTSSQINFEYHIHYLVKSKTQNSHFKHQERVHMGPTLCTQCMKLHTIYLQFCCFLKCKWQNNNFYLNIITVHNKTIFNLINIKFYLATPRYFETPLENPLLLRLKEARYSSFDNLCISSISVWYVSTCILTKYTSILEKKN